jgi:hypothetical protein
MPVAAIPDPSSIQRIAYAVLTGSESLASRANDDRRLERDLIGSRWATTALIAADSGASVRAPAPGRAGASGSPHQRRRRRTSVLNGGFVMARTIDRVDERAVTGR